MAALYAQKSTSRRTLSRTIFVFIRVPLIARCFYLMFFLFATLKKSMSRVYAVYLMLCRSLDVVSSVLERKPPACINAINNIRFCKRPKQSRLIQLTAVIARSSINDTLISRTCASNRKTGGGAERRGKWGKARERRPGLSRNFKKLLSISCVCLNGHNAIRSAF